MWQCFVGTAQIHRPSLRLPPNLCTIEPKCAGIVAQLSILACQNIAQMSNTSFYATIIVIDGNQISVAKYIA